MSTFTAHAWGQGFDKWFTLCSRVLEKTPHYYIACLKEVLDGCEASDFEHLVLWTDGPTQMKSRVGFGTIGKEYLEHFGFKSVEFNYGCPKHFKNEIDGHFGCLSKLLDTAAAGTRMVSVGDAVAEYRKHFARRACMHPAEPPHVILEFMPKLKRTYPWLLFTVDSLLGIKYSYSFSFVRNDVRRRTLHGREDSTVLTGLDFRNHRITRQACTVRDRGFPVLDDDIYAYVEADEEDLEPGEDEVEELLTVATQEHLGWRTSYTMEKTENAQREARRKHLIKINSKCEMRGAVGRLEPQRSRKKSSIAATAAESSKKKYILQKAVLDFDRAARNA